MKSLILILLVVAISNVGYSQDYKFGKVSKEELKEKFYPLDSNASAAYLYKNRKTYFKYIQGKGFLVITEIHERIKIYNKSGFDWATKGIDYYSPENGDREKVSIEDAKTFSIVDGKIKSNKLENKNVYKETADKNWSIKKFAMPNVSEGCIVEWKYKITSPYRIHNVEMQYSIPIRKFKSSIEIPEYYNYSVRQIGLLQVNLSSQIENSTIKLTSKSREGKYVSKTNYTTQKINHITNVTNIEEDNIPAFIEEPYINDINNYLNSIHYELTSVKWPNEPIKYYSQNWEDVAKTIFDNENFGSELKKTNHLKDDIETLKTKYTTIPQKIIGALEYVKSKIKWNESYGKFTEKGLRKAYKEGVGNVGDVNLTLVSVLRELGINANPVLVSTRTNGVPIFPTLSGFNYVIAIAETPDGLFLLDATEKYSLPNILPKRVLNWKGTIVRPDKSIDFVNLSSSSYSLQESKMNYKISIDGGVEGLNRISYKNYSALNYRSQYAGISEESLRSNIEEINDIEILNFKLSNLNNLPLPIVEMYKFKKENAVEIIGNKMYITPLLFSAATENPFKLDNREYAIDFATQFEEKVIVSIQIPEGYTFESLPEDVAVGMNEDLGAFIYSVKNQGSKIQVISAIKINKGVIPATYYAEIKEMFKQIVTKQSEKIVLSKN